MGTIFGVQEKIDLPQGQSYRVLRWKENAREVERVVSSNQCVRAGAGVDHWHYHEAYQLTLYLAGQGTRFVGDHIAPFFPGDLVMIGENLPHYWHCPGPSSGLSVQWLFPPSHPFWAFPEAAPLVSFFKSAARGIRFSGRTATAIGGLLHELTVTDGMARLATLMRIFATAASAPSREQTRLSVNVFSLSGESRHQSAMQSAIKFLTANFRSDVRLSQLLEVTHMSKPTFSRQFKIHAGKTLNEFLQQIRLDAACRALVETETPIIEVAVASGFTQISFFNRIFRRALKCSPSEYRERAHRRNGFRRTKREGPGTKD